MSLVINVDGIMTKIQPNQEFSCKNFIDNKFIVECKKLETKKEVVQISQKPVEPYKGYKKQIKDES